LFPALHERVLVHDLGPASQGLTRVKTRSIGCVSKHHAGWDMGLELRRTGWCVGGAPPWVTGDPD